jgi:hypothetical protein
MCLHVSQVYQPADRYDWLTRLVRHLVLPAICLCVPLFEAAVFRTRQYCAIYRRRRPDRPSNGQNVGDMTEGPRQTQLD